MAAKLSCGSPISENDLYREHLSHTLLSFLEAVNVGLLICR